MQEHHKDFWVSEVLVLCYTAVVLDAMLLLWGYQVGQWLRTSCSGKTDDDGTRLGSWLLLWCVVY